jgi:TetR/AcrR family transcriptional repressor of mexJK operon
MDSIAHSPPHRRGDVRRAALLVAARETFLAHGYEGTQMQAVARRAGASKETLYRHFPDKAALFQAVIRGIADRLGAQVADPTADMPVREALEAFGMSFLQGVLHPDALALHRLAIAEAERFPELGRVFNETGPAVVRIRLTDFLAGATARGSLKCADPGHAASLLLGALIADLQLRSLLGFSPQRESLTSHVAEAVAMFIARYATTHT